MYVHIDCEEEGWGIYGTVEGPAQVYPAPKTTSENLYGATWRVTHKFIKLEKLPTL